MAESESVKHDLDSASDLPLPPLLTGTPWKRRRRELLELLFRHQFGHTPAGAVGVSVELVESGPWPGGGALRRQFRLCLGAPCEGQAINLLVYTPTATRVPAGCFLSPNFNGNQSITSDPAVRISPGLKPLSDGDSRRQGDEPRGLMSEHLPVEAILAAGYAVATFHVADVEEDSTDGWRQGIRSRFPIGGESDWGAIGAWAWACSRCLDELLKLPEIDGSRVAVMGHSRLGKTALWAGAQDERFALVVSNNSGAGGAKPARRDFGEPIANFGRVFPHWFCRRYLGYAGRETEMPLDSHMLLALTAPRLLCVGSAEEDKWADPRGEFLACVAASAAWDEFGRPGLGTTSMPAAGGAVGFRLRYHLRAGPHGVRPEDWGRYLAAMASLSR
jgi:hypothetical protein